MLVSKFDKQRRNRIIIYVMSIVLVLLIILYYNIPLIKAYLMANDQVSNYFTLQEPSTTVADVTVSDYGQYVDLGTSILPKTGDTITIKLEDNEQPLADWRVFLKDSNNGVWLILADYMPVSVFSVSDVGLDANSQTDRYVKYAIYSRTDRKTLKDGLNGVISGKANWNGLISGSDLYDNGNLINNNIQVKGAFELEEWIESWNANSNYSQLESIYYASAVSGISSAQGYKLKGGYTNVSRDTENTLGFVAYVNIDSTKGSDDYRDTLYFPHHNRDSFDGSNHCDGYWLASYSSLNNTRMIFVDYRRWCCTYTCWNGCVRSSTSSLPTI